MSFHEIRFPDEIDYGFTGSHSKWKTEITINDNGNEKRNQKWSKPRGSWNLSKSIQSEAEIDAIRAFHIARRGRLFGFRLKDWSDYKIIDQEIGIGDALQTVFNIIKTYTDGLESYDRRIFKPVDGTVTVYLDDVLQTGDFDIDYVVGTISFTGGPPGIGVVVSVDAEFDTPVRFDTDDLDITMNEFNSSSISNLPIIEIKL